LRYGARHDVSTAAASGKCEYGTRDNEKRQLTNVRHHRPLNQHAQRERGLAIARGATWQGAQTLARKPFAHLQRSCAKRVDARAPAASRRMLPPETKKE